VTQTSDIIDALRKAGIPLNTDQIAEQVPHVSRANISALCSQLRKREILVGGVEDGRLAFTIAPGALPFKLDGIDLDREAGVELAPVDDEATDEKPPTQSFSPTGMELRPAVEESGTPGRVSETVEALIVQTEKRRRAQAETTEPPKGDAPANPELTAAASATRIQATVGARTSRNDGRLCRELAAAVLQRWPGEIPYDVQRLVNSAAALSL
jgi:hypothetical protein